MRSARQFELALDDRADVEARAESARACAQQLFATCMRLRIKLEAAAVPPRVVPPRESRLCREAESALRAQVKEFADLLRRTEASPEEVVVRVKQLMRDGCAQTPNVPRRTVRDLGDAVVRWTVESYFATD